MIWTLLFLLLSRLPLFVFTQELYVTEGEEELTEEEDTEVPVLMLAVSGGRMTLPCDIISPMTDDEVYLVLWYKDEIATPIYSLDARRGRIGQARHATSEELSGRAYFSSVSSPAVLEVDQVSSEDEGLYRCRVDFRKARTRHSAILLRVVVPPGPPIIKDYNGEILTDVIGPYNEGDSLHLICQTEGGKPEPTLTWWKGRKMIDETYEEMSPGVIRNELTIQKLQRQNLMSRLTCRAANNKISTPVETAVTLDINFRPLTVNIRGKKRRLSAKKTVQFECETKGSRPAAAISWRKGSSKLKGSDKTSTEGNLTISTLTFTPTSEDNGKFLYCQAENSVIPGSSIEDGWKLEVHYIPQLTLRLGSKLRYSNIVEGNDVYFECNIRANPWVSETGWKFEGKELQTNISAGVIVSNQSLVLQKVQRINRGRYSCTATNSEGLGESNHVYLRVQYSPVCKPNQETIHGAMLHYPVQIPCEVESDPDDVTFRWEFNSSSGSQELIPTYTSGTKSLVNYIPRTESDFGTLYCWGRNSVGHQKLPCMFTVNPAEPPSPVHNCSVFDETERSFRVSCIEGKDGGLNQYFYTEIRDISSKFLLQNVSAHTPDFSASGLSPGTIYIVAVYASNARGRSQPTTVRASTVSPPESQTRKDDDWELTLSPIIIILCGVAGGLLFVIIIVLIMVKVVLSRRKSRKDASAALQNEKSIQGSEKSGDTCSEGCTCTTREEEKYRENIPDVVVFSEKVKPEDEEMITPYPSDSVYWERGETPTIGTRGNEYVQTQMKMKNIHGPQSSNWPTQEWVAQQQINEPITLQFQSLQEDTDSRGLDQRHGFPLQTLPTIDEAPSSPTVLTVLPSKQQHTMVSARQTDV